MYSKTRVPCYRGRSYVYKCIHKHVQRKFTRNKLTPRGKFDREIGGGHDPFSFVRPPKSQVSPRRDAGKEFSHSPSLRCSPSISCARSCSFTHTLLGSQQMTAFYRYRRRNVIFYFLVIFVYFVFIFTSPA